jgi:ketosteroid isomerase-like protein
MSGKNVEIVRQPIAVRAQSQRRLEERVALRFPRVVPISIRGLLRLPAHSRLRRWLLRRYFRHGLEALNRGDFEAIFCLWGSDSEFVPIQELGFEGTRGQDDRIRFQQQWVDDWGAFRFEPEEIIDLGDNRRLMWLGHTRGSGRSSGVPIDSECGVIVTLSGGWVIREEVYFDRARALATAGLRE